MKKRDAVFDGRKWQCPKCGKWTDIAPRFYRDGVAFFIHEQKVRRIPYPAMEIVQSCTVDAPPDRFICN